MYLSKIKLLGQMNMRLTSLYDPTKKESSERKANVLRLITGSSFYDIKMAWIRFLIVGSFCSYCRFDFLLWVCFALIVG